VDPFAPKASPLPKTDWRLIRASEARDAKKRRAALSRFYGLYWRPLLYNVSRRGYDPDTACDLTQSFFIHLIETRALAAACPSKGRFRTFLLALLDRYLADQYKHARRQKRGGGAAHLSFDDPVLVELAGLSDPGRRPDEDSASDLAWGRALLDRAFDRLEKEHRADERRRLFVGLRPHLYSLEPDKVYARLSRHLGRPRATLRSDLRRLRLRHLELLREELRSALGPLPSDEERAMLRLIIRSAL
jgi:RNA polymerase sigma-70 factor (ECF subfamily)